MIWPWLWNATGNRTKRIRAVQAGRTGLEMELTTKKDRKWLTVHSGANGGRMKTVILESPYAGDSEVHIRYARACMGDCLRRGEAPFASHLLYTQPGVLDDRMPDERNMGIAAGLAIGDLFDATVVYTDLGISSGMEMGIERAELVGREVIYRTNPKWPIPMERDWIMTDSQGQENENS